MGFLSFLNKPKEEARRSPGALKGAPATRARPSQPAQVAKPTPEAPPASDIGARSRPITQLIEDYQDVPTHSGVLTLGSKAIDKIPPDLIEQVTVLELGPKRAGILFDPVSIRNQQVAATISSLRGKLISAGYGCTDFPCKREVIKIIVHDASSRQGTSTDPERAKSDAQRRFLGWLEMAVEQGASDLHVIVEGQGRALVQLRVNGELENLKDARKGVYSEIEAKEAMAWPYNAMTSRGSNSDSTWNEGKNSYCMTDPREVGGKKISLRYQQLRGSRGPKLVCRLLNVDQDLPAIPFANLGFAPSQVQIYRDVADMECGLIILSGITGSGKTTTVKTFLETHPRNGSAAFYSVEDPVEYHLKGVHQISLQRDTADAEGSKKLYAQQMADLMRADPDMAFIGEIRDMASAGAAQSLVATGHNSLATLHAHLLSGITRRLTDEEIGMSRGVLTAPNMLSLLSYQALVPTLCPHCAFDKKGVLADLRMQAEKGIGRPGYAEALEENIAILDRRFRVDTSTLRFRNEEGCSHCRGRGTNGQTVVAELFMPDRPWLEFTREGKDYEAMQHYRLQSDRRFDTEDMTGKTVFEHTLYKALQGRVDVRQCERFTLIRRYEISPDLKNRGVVAVPGGAVETHAPAQLAVA